MIHELIIFACDGVHSAVIQILDWSELVAYKRTIIMCFKFPELFRLEHVLLWFNFEYTELLA